MNLTYRLKISRMYKNVEAINFLIRGFRIEFIHWWIKPIYQNLFPIQTRINRSKRNDREE